MSGLAAGARRWSSPAGDLLLAAPPQAAPRFCRWLRQERNMEAISNMLGNLLRHLGN